MKPDLTDSTACSFLGNRGLGGGTFGNFEASFFWEREVVIS